MLNQWLRKPPHGLVVGAGAYTRALALILRYDRITLEEFKAFLPPSPGSGLPLVLTELQRVLLVADAQPSAGDVVRGVDQVWLWIAQLSRLGPDHEVAFLLIGPPGNQDGFREALAVGLALSPDDMLGQGYGFARMGDSLENLMGVLASVCPSDHVCLTNRRARDNRRASMRNLAESVRVGEITQVVQAAAIATAAFAGQMHLLDLFCRAPSHANGNSLRSRLHTLVTGGVTPQEEWREIPRLLEESAGGSST